MSIWTNKKKFGKREFVGSYTRITKNGERNFVLTATNGTREISFESYQAAKALGWIKK